MIVWLILLTVLLLATTGLSIYSFIITRRNTKAILEVMAPLWEKHEKQLYKLLSRK